MGAAHRTRVNQSAVCIQDADILDVHTLVVEDVDILMLSINLDMALHEIFNTGNIKRVVGLEGDEVGPVTVVVGGAVGADLPQIRGVRGEVREEVAVARNVGNRGQGADRSLVLDIEGSCSRMRPVQLSRSAVDMAGVHERRNLALSQLEGDIDGVVGHHVGEGVSRQSAEAHAVHRHIVNHVTVGRVEGVSLRSTVVHRGVAVRRNRTVGTGGSGDRVGLDRHRGRDGLVGVDSREGVGVNTVHIRGAGNHVGTVHRDGGDIVSRIRGDHEGRRSTEHNGGRARSDVTVSGLVHRNRVLVSLERGIDGVVGGHAGERVGGHCAHRSAVHEHIAHMIAVVGSDRVSLVAVVSHVGDTGRSDRTTVTGSSRDGEVSGGEGGGDGMVSRQSREGVGRNCTHRSAVNRHIADHITLGGRDGEGRSSTVTIVGRTRSDRTVGTGVHRDGVRHQGEGSADGVVILNVGEGVGGGSQSVSLRVAGGLTVNRDAGDVITRSSRDVIHCILMVEIRGDTGRRNRAVCTGSSGNRVRAVHERGHVVVVARDVGQRVGEGCHRISHRQIDTVAGHAGDAVTGSRRSGESIGVGRRVVELNTRSHRAVAVTSGRDDIVVGGEDHLNSVVAEQVLEGVDVDDAVLNTVDDDAGHMITRSRRDGAQQVGVTAQSDRIDSREGRVAIHHKRVVDGTFASEHGVGNRGAVETGKHINVLVFPDVVDRQLILIFVEGNDVGSDIHAVNRHIHEVIVRSHRDDTGVGAAVSNNFVVRGVGSTRSVVVVRRHVEVANRGIHHIAVGGEGHIDIVTIVRREGVVLDRSVVLVLAHHLDHVLVDSKHVITGVREDGERVRFTSRSLDDAFRNNGTVFSSVSHEVDGREDREVVDVETGGTGNAGSVEAEVVNAALRDLNRGVSRHIVRVGELVGSHLVVHHIVVTNFLAEIDTELFRHGRVNSVVAVGHVITASGHIQTRGHQPVVGGHCVVVGVSGNTVSDGEGDIVVVHVADEPTIVDLTGVEGLHKREILGLNHIDRIGDEEVVLKVAIGRNLNPSGKHVDRIRHGDMRVERVGIASILGERLRQRDGLVDRSTTIESVVCLDRVQNNRTGIREIDCHRNVRQIASVRNVMNVIENHI